MRAYAERGGRRGPRRGGAATSCPDDGWFGAPTVVADLPPDSPVLREEIFGPLVAVERYPSVDAACDALEASPFALTGGLFSRNPRHGRAGRAAHCRSATST